VTFITASLWNGEETGNYLIGDGCRYDRQV